jgi:hypothetical protein
VIVKVDDNGTPEFSDDSLLDGALFELRLDDGDAAYEPQTDDAPIVASATSEFGFAHFDPPTEFGRYWVTEAAAPPGFDVAPPLLIPYEAANEQQNCVVSEGQVHCVPDDDLSGGLVLAFVANSPLGGGLPDTGVPESANEAPPALVAAGLALLGGGLVAVLAVRRTVRTERTSKN